MFVVTCVITWSGQNEQNNGDACDRLPHALICSEFAHRHRCDDGTHNAPNTANNAEKPKQPALPELPLAIPSGSIYHRYPTASPMSTAIDLQHSQALRLRSTERIVDRLSFGYMQTATRSDDKIAKLIPYYWKLGGAKYPENLYILEHLRSELI